MGPKWGRNIQYETKMCPSCPFLEYSVAWNSTPEPLEWTWRTKIGTNSYHSDLPQLICLRLYTCVTQNLQFISTYCYSSHCLFKNQLGWEFIFSQKFIKCKWLSLSLHSHNLTWFSRINKTRPLLTYSLKNNNNYTCFII